MNKVILSCSFCGKKQTDVEKIIQGPHVTICNECVSRCYTLLSGEKVKNKNIRLQNDISVVELKKYVDQYIIGQEKAKKILCVSISNHFKRITNPIIDGVEIEKENILLVGPTASGKTALVKTIAKKLRIPFVSCDSTLLSEVGYVGSDPDTIIKSLIRAAGGDISLAEKGIIFIDEIDKKSKKDTITKDASGEGVQYSLLKMIEGTIIDVEVPSKKGVEKVRIDTSNILFILAGAFSGIEHIVNKRTKNTSIGFNTVTETDVEKKITQDDIISYGIIPELVGRLPILAVLEKLSIEEIKLVLKTTKNSIIKQYEKIFKIDGLELLFSDDAIDYIAQQTYNNETGIRGLRSFIEERLIDVQYDIEKYKDCNVEKIIINSTFFEVGNSPELVYKNDIAETNS